MSLKEEVDKIIRAEREKLERADRISSAFKAQQITRFHPLKAAIKELVECFDPTLINVKFENECANIELCKHNSMRLCLTPTYLKVSPSFAWKKGNFLATEGFDVVEMKYERGFSIPKEDPVSYKTEHEVIKYLTSRIAKRIVLIEHREAFDH